MCDGGGVGTLRGISNLESENTAIVNYPQIHITVYKGIICHLAPHVLLSVWFVGCGRDGWQI